MTEENSESPVIELLVAVTTEDFVRMTKFYFDALGDRDWYLFTQCNCNQGWLHISNSYGYIHSSVVLKKTKKLPEIPAAFLIVDCKQ